ncbi:GatB/YqeY domain-containing protein [Iodidimonas sp. SYSU 1G8]|uniref:GatB/YqeY domain-containing protein n=1 Tax=Iodidimonas sp. SYSU 1G8 TaxID=3133967 RepID=UPI0031FEAAB8
MLRDQLSEALKNAMRAQEKRRTTTLRLILAAIKDRDIAGRENGSRDLVGDEEILQLLQKMVRQRRESIETFEQGGRLELAEQEREEIAIIEDFLPKQMSEAEIVAAVDAVVADLGAAGVKDMGRVMATLRERYPGTMDFGKASAAAKQRLS